MLFPPNATIRLTGAFILSVGLSTTAFSQAPTADKAAQFAQTITAGDLEKHLRIIAADDMQGRETGTPGQKKAADYISRQFSAEGLTPLGKGTDGKASYLQPFQLYKKSWGDFYIKSGGKQFVYQQDFVANGLLNLPTETTYETVFVGYGITDEGYDDYAGLDVKGKAVVMLDGEPKLADGNWVIGKTNASKWGGLDSYRAKTTLAKDKGAAEIFIVSMQDAAGFKQLLAQRSALQGRANRLSLKPVTENVGTVGTFIVNAETGAVLLDTKPAKLQKEIDKITKDGKTTAGSLKGSVSIKAERKDDNVPTENVAGFLEGTDKKDEVIIISGHYDHVGVTATGQVNNGANDDGSGTVSVLEIAQAFSKAKAAGSGPRRSILFLTVVGEEKGLLGSAYYADISPILPLDKTVCDLNIDMVGRVDDIHASKTDSTNYIYVIGSDKLSSDLHKISEDVNMLRTQMVLDYKYNDPADPQRIYYRSDHYNFAKHKIPIIFYFNGLHKDYHQPTDDVDKINFNLAEKSARLVFYTAWEIANRDGRLVVDSSKP